MDVDNADDDEDEDDEDEIKAKKRPPQGLLKVSQALQGLGYIYERDRNARHPDTPSVRAGAVYWKAKDAIARSKRLRLKRGKQTIKIRFDDDGNPIREERVVQLLDKVKGILDDSTLDSEDFLTAEEDELDEEDEGDNDDD